MDNDTQMMADIESSMISDEISLRELLRILLLRYIWVIAVFAVVMAGVVFYLQITTPQYESEVTVLVESLQKSSAIEDLISGQSSTKISTEVELILSDRNINAALALLDLSSYRNKDGVDYQNVVVSTELKKRINVSTVKDTNIVKISVTDANAQFAADFANAIACSYNDLLGTIARNSKTMQKTFIEEQIPLNEQQLQEAALALGTFREESNIFQLSDKSKLLSEKIAFFQLFREPLMLQLNEAIVTAQQLRLLLSEEGYTMPSYEELTADSRIASLTTFYEEKYRETVLYQALRNGGDELNMRHYSLESSTSQTSKELLDRISLLILSGEQERALSDPYLKLQVSALAQALQQRLVTETEIIALTNVEASYAEQLSQLPALERMQLDLEREVQVLETLRLRLLELLEEVKIAEAAISHNVTVVDEAKVSLYPVSPKKLLILAVGMLIGLGLGVLTALFVEMLDVTIKDEMTVRRLVKANLPMLGWTPLTNFNNNSKIPELPVYSDPSSFEAERYKLIASNIVFSLPNTERNIISITSAGMGEGKTMVTANIATALAQNGKRVLIIDGDLRLSQQETFFNLKKSGRGLVDIIRKEKSPEEVIVRPLEEFPTLHLLPPGVLPPMPSAIFTSDLYNSLLEYLRNRYDYIFIDTPPLIFASELMSIAKRANAMVVVVRAGVTVKGTFAELMDNLKLARINVIGYVFNGVLERQASGYYTSGRYYAYRGYSYSKRYYQASGSSDEKVGKKSRQQKVRGNYRSNYRKALKLREKRRGAGQYVALRPFLNGTSPFHSDESKVQPVAARNLEVDSVVKAQSMDDLLTKIEQDPAASGRQRS